jgi:hypothetical protein
MAIASQPMMSAQLSIDCHDEREGNALTSEHCMNPERSYWPIWRRTCIEFPNTRASLLFWIKIQT